jgi:hypothetical protein
MAHDDEAVVGVSAKGLDQEGLQQLQLLLRRVQDATGERGRKVKEK